MSDENPGRSRGNIPLLTGKFFKELCSEQAKDSHRTAFVLGASIFGIIEVAKPNTPLLLALGAGLLVTQVAQFSIEEWARHTAKMSADFKSAVTGFPGEQTSTTQKRSSQDPDDNTLHR